MDGVARFELGDGNEVLVELGAEQTAGLSRVGRGDDVVAQAQKRFDEAFAQVRDAASSALGQLTALPSRPDEVELKFGVKLDAQAGAIIARTGAQAQFEVKLRWQRDPLAEVRREDEQVDEVPQNPDPDST